MKEKSSSTTKVVPCPEPQLGVNPAFNQLGDLAYIAPFLYSGPGVESGDNASPTGNYELNGIAT